jgi:hypothetical protein
MNGLDLAMLAGWTYACWALHHHLVAYRDR